MCSTTIWNAVGHAIEASCATEDDLQAWRAIVDAVYSDAEQLLSALAASVDVTTEIGRCSHWLRPHQTRWTADGGFAWPTGYEGRRYSMRGIPEFDWCEPAVWNHEGSCWNHCEALPANQKSLHFRVAVPNRTARHDQAAVHTIWRPGPPQHRLKELLQFYGFRKRNGVWGATAYWADPDGKAYERQETAV